RTAIEPPHGVSTSQVPFQLDYRPQKQKAPTFGRSLREFQSELRVLRTDKSRRPNAIDAPSHHGFDPYHHCESEYSMRFKVFLQFCELGFWNELSISKSNPSFSCSLIDGLTVIFPPVCRPT